ncbi:unnamed protein product [Pseudo-nitzschia multistriata]|uniref:Uncharacterized protein n=1 Tax=Pseudo-nitzschia multistriata TaxID=183589 RepID=A0A448Z2P8_9STRA|nr:unnamed protein product [Pseudo-nitzschia multistriata]VEU41103.1 unnamed protein product [Pseudo-nitzschia multistriata]
MASPPISTAAAAAVRSRSCVAGRRLSSHRRPRFPTATGGGPSEPSSRSLYLAPLGWRSSLSFGGRNPTTRRCSQHSMAPVGNRWAALAPASTATAVWCGDRSQRHCYHHYSRQKQERQQKQQQPMRKNTPAGGTTGHGIFSSEGQGTLRHHGGTFCYCLASPLRGHLSAQHHLWSPCGVRENATTLHSARSFSSVPPASLLHRKAGIYLPETYPLLGNPAAAGRIGRIGFRKHSSNGNSSNNSNGTKEKAPQSTPPPTTVNPSESNNNKIQEFMDSTVSTVRTNVGSAEATIKKAVEELSTGDLLSVYGIVFLIVLIGVMPSLVRRMQSSDHYDSKSEDPLLELARMIRGEFLENVNRIQEDISEADGDGDGSDTDAGDAEGRKRSSLGLDRIVADLLRSPQIQEAATTLVTKVLQSQQFKAACALLLRELLRDLLDDPDTLDQLVHLLQTAIADEKIREAAIGLATDVFGDDRVLDELVVLVQRLGMEGQVMAATQALLVESAHNALNDPEILDHSMEFATDVVGDDVVQQTAGEALYNTMSYAFRPALSVFLALTGVGLIFVSISAFRNLAQTPSDAADRAFLGAIETYTSRLLKVLFLPLDFLVACKDALVAIALFPFRFLSSSAARAGDLGKALLGAVRDWLFWLVHLPFELLSSVLSASSHALGAAATNLVDKLGGWLRAVGESLFGLPCQRLGELSSELLERATDRFGAMGSSAREWFSAVPLRALERLSSELLEAATARLGGWASALGETNAGVKLQELARLTSGALEQTRIRWRILNEFLSDGALRVEELGSRVVASLAGMHALPFETQRKQYFDKASKGYESLNHSLARFAFWLEDLLGRMAGII